MRTAGNIKRTEAGDADEEMLMCRTLRDMNLSKFVAQDVPLFLQLLNDIFPKQKGKIKDKKYPEVEKSVQAYLKEMNLDDKPSWYLKIIQLFETKEVRHGFMTVGPAGTGKSTIMNALTEALTNNG